MSIIEISKRPWSQKKFYDLDGIYHIETIPLWVVLVNGICRDTAMTRDKARERARCFKKEYAL